MKLNVESDGYTYRALLALCSQPWCHADGPSVSPRWTPIGTGDPLYFGSGDGPEAEIPHVVLFADPTLEDPTHMSTFYFEGAEAWRQAAVALDLPRPCSAPRSPPA